MRSTVLDTDGRAGPMGDRYVDEVQAGGTVLGQGSACSHCASAEDSWERI